MGRTAKAAMLFFDSFMDVGVVNGIGQDESKGLS